MRPQKLLVAVAAVLAGLGHAAPGLGADLGPVLEPFSGPGVIEETAPGRLIGCTISARLRAPINSRRDPSYVGSPYGLGRPSYYGMPPPLGIDPLARPTLSCP